ncbi:Serine/threonine-protein kinase STY46 (Serine/threonine/tyrosine-protein kinase 46) [Durusdinium trenchii]|uniref:Serine/threonine-protein kinase STY46 (Serine/threonine/tyrosine-protein kinase 46) n=1 Tax=Durusdinium trenchii TaxID=1381693 RepID=A0ABP0IGG1_9DINO
MSSYGELIQALRVLKNVKEKRHGIKTLASLCSNRAFQVRIVQRGGWRTAILPLIISLDEDCRMYAALAVANLSTSAATHPQLLEEEVLRHLVPILQSEEVQEVIAYVLNALGNFACSEIMWHELQQMNAADGILTILKQTQREEIRINCLFCLANLTADPWHRKWMMGKEVYEIIWSYMQDPNYTIMSYSLAILRGLAVETEAQELFPSMGLVPLLIGIYHSQCPQSLKTLSMDLLLHFSMFKQNAGLMMEKEVAQVIELAGRGTGHVEYVPIGIAIIANICESVDLHDRIVESPLFEVLTEHIHNDNTNVQTHVIRALMQLSLSPKYHHVILTTGAMANVCPIALTQRLSIGMRTNALQMMAAVCATHPTTPTTSDIIDLMFLIVNSEENIDIRRAAALVIANASSDSGNLAGRSQWTGGRCCIGSGVTSEVYQGHWTRIGQVVAIKAITERSAIRPDEQLAFAREMHILTQVQHENLVKFYGVCIDMPPLRIITEFCEGGACFELLHNSDEVDLIWPQQIKMCKDVAAAMCYLHTFDPMIIHRDLKSLNLLLDRPVFGPTDEPVVKVCDFGVAKLQASPEGWGQMTAQAGTKHWMAPEMWRGTKYDEKVDVFSYAMVVYEIVCREVPFEQEEPHLRRNRHILRAKGELNHEKATFRGSSAELKAAQQKYNHGE